MKNSQHKYFTTDELCPTDLHLSSPFKHFAMTKLLLFIAGVLSLGTALGQNKTASENTPTGRIQSYLDKAPVLYPYVSLNQDKFAPGDTVFFSAQLMDASNRAVKGRAILQVALFDVTGRMVDRAYFNTKDGSGFSQFVLPDTLSVGRYRVMVYSDWMRNFNLSTSFQKEISVVKDKSLIKKPEAPTASFFVEGGKLVQSVPNKVVAITNQKGVVWQVKDDKQQIVAQFITDNTGQGFMVFTPQPGVRYMAVPEGSDKSSVLPNAVAEGASILLTPNQNGEPVKVLLAAPQGSALRGDDLTVLVVAEQGIQYSAAVNLGDKEAVAFAIPQKKMPEGIAQLLVLDKNSNLVAQRCFLVQEPDTLKSAFTVKQQQVNQRGFVRLDVALADRFNNRLKGEFSVSAVNKNLFIDQNASSDVIPGIVNHVFTERADPAQWNRLNNQLIAFNGFYDWAAILKKNNAAPEHPLRSLIYKTGKAVYKTTGEPVPDSTVLTVYLQKHFMGYEALVEKDGRFDLAFLFDFYGKDDLFYVAEHRGKLLKDVVINWTDESISLPPGKPWIESETTDPYGAFRAKSQLIVPSYSFFTASSEKKSDVLVNPNAEFEDEFMGADVSVNIEDYVVFPTMEELIREVIPSLQHRRMRGNSTVRVVYSVPSILPTGDPVYIIDGVMTKRTDFFLSLKPADILIVKIEKDLSKLTRLGAIGKNGIVYVQTKKKEIAEQLRRENSITPIQGLNKPIARKNLSYEGTNDPRKPDFRSTVYWDPSVKTDASGEATIGFYVGDDVGPIQIRINGFTEDGRPFSAVHELTVNFGPTAKN